MANSLVHKLQEIPNPTADDIHAINTMLGAMGNESEHERQRGRLDAISAREVEFQGPERVKLATTSCQAGTHVLRVDEPACSEALCAVIAVLFFGAVSEAYESGRGEKAKARRAVEHILNVEARGIGESRPTEKRN
ncbi:hypothetical protein FRC07_004137, partial [Ceratobasidium sp. 392]